MTYREANALITALRRPAAYDHPVGRIVLLETHISWVLLSGPYAYKVKKPVSFGFVDFSTLELRRQFCAEELRLNQRLAPDLYLDVVPILGPVGQARFGPPEALMGPSDAPLEDELDAMIDVAVRMRQFDQDDLLPAALKRGAINGGMIDRLAHDLACFQARAAIAAPSGPYGSFEAVVAPADANIAALMAVEVPCRTGAAPPWPPWRRCCPPAARRSGSVKATAICTSATWLCWAGGSPCSTPSSSTRPCVGST